jgi:aminotransferase EvaB
MSIRVWDYRKEYEEHRQEILAAVDKVFSSGRLILGQSVKDFETAFMAYCGASSGVGVNSGTDALFIGLKALGIGAGDEVITVSNTAVPTVSAIVAAGATPTFVDVDPDTCLMDVGKLDEALTDRTKCVLPVHLYGQCADMDVINEFAEAHRLKVLDDCAQSVGALNKGRMCGSMSDVAAFSFYPTKILGAYGDGGMIVSNDLDLADQARSLRMYGMTDEYYAEVQGYNSRLDEVQAEILSCKLKYVDQWIDRRRDLAEEYDRRLKDMGLQLPREAKDNRHTYYLYVVGHPRRDQIIEELKKRDIFVNVSYPYPIHTMRAYDYLGYKEGDFPITENLAKTIFSLPMYPTLTDEEQDAVCRALEDILS